MPGPDRRPSEGYVIRTDGAARGNPGPASLGAALYDMARPDARHHRAEPDASISDYLGVQTNNVAEYTGVVRALDLAATGAREVASAVEFEAHRGAAHRPLAGEGRQAHPVMVGGPPHAAGFDRWSAAHVPRAQNSVADALANEAIDRAMAGGRRRSFAGRKDGGHRVALVRIGSSGGCSRDRSDRGRPGPGRAIGPSAGGRSGGTSRRWRTNLAFIVQFGLVVGVLACSGCGCRLGVPAGRPRRGIGGPGRPGTGSRGRRAASSPPS